MLAAEPVALWRRQHLSLVLVGDDDGRILFLQAEVLGARVENPASRIAIIAGYAAISTSGSLRSRCSSCEALG